MPSSAPQSLTSVYALPEALLVVSNHQTDAGFWIAAEPVFRLAPDAEPAVLGAAVRASLAAARRGVPAPRRDGYAERLRPLLEAAGLRTWATLERRGRLCVVRQESGAEVSVVPTRHGGTAGPGKGFHELPDAAARLPLRAPDATLGEEVRSALALRDRAT